MADYLDMIANYIEREQRVLAELDHDAINRAMNALVAACERDATIYVLGNGGSAATASHFVCDFAKGAYLETGLAFRMVCLSDNTPTLTAIANDTEYADVFALQLKDRVRSGDVLIAISGSGNSENVIRAVDYAKAHGAEIVSLTGYDGGRLKSLSDHSLHVPVHDMQITEDVHMMFDHLMMSVLCSMHQAGGAR